MAEQKYMISESEKRELEEVFSSANVQKCTDDIQKKNSEWMKEPLNIAVTGASGVGKSSFINAVRCISADDEGGAHVGVVETTKEIKQYPHPKYNNLVFWDLPGVGTPTFPRSTYLRQVHFKKYDFFLVLSASRFTEDDLWLAKEIGYLNKQFYFVRTQIDVDVEKDKKGQPKTHSKDKVIKQVREDCQKNLESTGLKAPVFLVDNYSPMAFDFDLLMGTMIDEAPDLKRNAMISSMSLLTDKIIKRKVEVLQSRIHDVSLLSAFFRAIPVPMLGAAVNVAILVEEVIFYKSQFGLDDETINKNAIFLKTDVSQLQTKLGLNRLTPLIADIQKMIASEAIGIVLPIAIPVFGSLISAVISYKVSVAVLNRLLIICSDDAMKIYNEIMNSLQ